MFDMGWGEMVVIGVVALVVVGPKELPTLFRSVGLYMGKARGMAREFTRAMEAAADETGVKEIDRQIRAAARPVQYATDRIKDSALKSPPKPAAAPLVLQNTAPGPATAALSAERTEEQARLKAEAAQRALDRARRDQEEAQLALERVRLEREAGTPEPAPAMSDETAAGPNA